MSDDVFLIKYDGYGIGTQIEDVYDKNENKNGEKRVIGWDGKLIPKSIIEKTYFGEERRKIDEAQVVVDETQSKLDEFIEEHTADEGVLCEFLNEKDAVDMKAVRVKHTVLKHNAPDSEEYKILSELIDLSAKVKEYAKLVKELNVELDKLEKEKYSKLSVGEVKELLVDKKWYYTIFDGISTLYSANSHNMANRISELANRYEFTLSSIEQEVEDFEKKVKSHLERMGFSW